MCWRYTLTLYLNLVFPSLSLQYIPPYICQVKTIACEAVVQFKSNLNIFKGVVIIYQEIVAPFAPLITTVKRTR